MNVQIAGRHRFNENYDGPDNDVAKAQFEGDGWLSEIARLRADPPHRLSLEDRAEIIELTALWDSAYDALDIDTWLSCLTDDFVFASRGFGEFNGKAAMKDYFNTYKTVFNGLRHVLSNHIIVGESPTTARQFCYLTVFDRIRSTQMMGTSPFFDRLVKKEGRWKFARRDQVVDPGMSQTEKGKALIARFTKMVADKKG